MSTQHDPKNIIVLYDGVPITGFAKGSFVEFEQKEDDFEVDVGADGESTFVRKRDEQGSAKVTLKASTASALYLSSQLAKQKASPDLLLGTLMIVNNNDRSEFLARCVIKKKPGKKYDDGSPTVEYEFLYANALDTDGLSWVI